MHYCFVFFVCGLMYLIFFFFFFQAEDGIRDGRVTGVQTCALPISPLKFDRLHVRAGQRDFEVERGAGGPLWRLTKPRLARADNALLQRLFQQLQTARVSQFVSDTPGSDLEPYGLQTPEVTLVFSQGANSVLTIEFGKSPTNFPGQVFARRLNYPSIVTVPKYLLDLLR